MHPGGHGFAPFWLMIDGMIWFEGRYLTRYGTEHADVYQDFEACMVRKLIVRPGKVAFSSGCESRSGRQPVPAPSPRSHQPFQ
jgi:hypothetical protein